MAPNWAGDGHTGRADPCTGAAACSPCSAAAIRPARVMTPVAETQMPEIPPEAVQETTEGMPGRDAIATRLAREIPRLGEDAAPTAAASALLALRRAGLALLPPDAARRAPTPQPAAR